MSKKHFAVSLTPTVSRRDVMKTSAAVALAGLAASALTSSCVHAAGNDEIRVGLIGCGGRGRGAAANAVAAAPNVKIVAIGDIFPDVIEETIKMWAEKPKAQYDVAGRTFSGWDAYKKVLECDINYVILATPPAFRPMMLEAAINAGKHVFAEKPIAVDPTGIRSVMKTAELAASKNLGICAGTQRRHQPSYIETIKRIQDGEIGQIVSGQVYWTAGEQRAFPRQPQWSDMEWQLRNWWYFTWLSGDIVVEQHVHQLDVANWVVGDHPRWAHCMGGRQVRVDPAFGHIYDHFATDFGYKSGARVLSMSRQIDNCYTLIQEHFIGTKGSAMADNRLDSIDGKSKIWKYTAAAGAAFNPYELEHKDFIESIRNGKPLNEGQRIAESTLCAIMARMSAYTGQRVLWDDALNSKLSLMPAKLDFGPIATPPVAMPGKDKLV